MTVHKLKTELPHFDHLWDGSKTFEIRRDDRGFEVGDCLVLVEWDGERETGRTVTAAVSHILKGGQLGLAEGWVVMSLRYPDRLTTTAPAIPRPLPHRHHQRAEGVPIPGRGKGSYHL